MPLCVKRFFSFFLTPKKPHFSTPRAAPKAFAQGFGHRIAARPIRTEEPVEHEGRPQTGVPPQWAGRFRMPVASRVCWPAQGCPSSAGSLVRCHRHRPWSTARFESDEESLPAGGRFAAGERCLAGAMGEQVFRSGAEREPKRLTLSVRASIRLCPCPTAPLLQWELDNESS